MMAPAKKTTAKKAVPRKSTAKKAAAKTVVAKFPRHSVRKALRIPRVILDQNAGKECSPAEAAGFLGGTVSGPFNTEISSARKYGYLEGTGKIGVSDLAKQVLRPQAEGDEINGLQTALLNAPDLSEVYAHYRGEYLPDDAFFRNALVDKFGIPSDKVDEFRDVFLESVEEAGLLERAGDRLRLLDVGRAAHHGKLPDPVGKAAKTGDHSGTCFVMQPFADPLGGYFETLYKPAIEKTGLKAVRADAEIFGTGKIIDQVWRGISQASVLVAELTSRNPNVFYELGLAHALGKPVVLVSSNEDDVPFDLHHIRVIYYDHADPFWGDKLMDKVSENILSALKDPEEAIFSVDAPAD